MAFCIVTFKPSGVSAKVEPGKSAGLGAGPATLLDVAIGHGLDIQHPCEGGGTCGLCRMVIEEGFDHLSPEGDSERQLLRAIGLDPARSRLACQAIVRGNVVCRVPGDEP